MSDSQDDGRTTDDMRAELLAVVSELARAEGCIADDDMVVEIVLVGAAFPPERTDDRHSISFTLAGSEMTPSYVFKGLLIQGLDNLRRTNDE